LWELAEKFGCTAPAVFYARRTLTITRKKDRYLFRKVRKQREKDADRLKRVPRNKRVYSDESGVNTYLQREYGRATRGEQIEAVKPGRHVDRVNGIGALGNGNHYGIGCYKQSTNGELFENWFVNYLLVAIPKGCTAIMDNAKVHRKAVLRKLARGKV
jgi:hypothetical protein